MFECLERREMFASSWMTEVPAELGAEVTSLAKVPNEDAVAMAALGEDGLYAVTALRKENGVTFSSKTALPYLPNVEIPFAHRITDTAFLTTGERIDVGDSPRGDRFLGTPTVWVNQVPQEAGLPGISDEAYGFLQAISGSGTVFVGSDNWITPIVVEPTGTTALPTETGGAAVGADGELIVGYDADGPVFWRKGSSGSWELQRFQIPRDDLVNGYAYAISNGIAVGSFDYEDAEGNIDTLSVLWDEQGHVIEILDFTDIVVAGHAASGILGLATDAGPYLYLTGTDELLSLQQLALENGLELPMETLVITDMERSSELYLLLSAVESDRQFLLCVDLFPQLPLRVSAPGAAVPFADTVLSLQVLSGSLSGPISFQVDWGDGHREVVKEGGLETEVSHRYLDVGLYTVTIDAFAGEDPIASATVGLEVTPCAVVTEGGKRMLLVSGTNGPDRIGIVGSAAGMVLVYDPAAPLDPQRFTGISAVYVWAGPGDDVVTARLPGQTVWMSGGDGGDVLHAYTSPATLLGDSGNDQLRGGPGQDLLFGGEGDDRLHGSGGQDRLYGGAGDDRLFGEADDDVLDGGDGSDRLDGGPGDDVVRGGNGSDRAMGGAGNDILLGQAAADYLFDLQGRNLLIGGAGADDLVVLPASGPDLLIDRSTVYDSDDQALRTILEVLGKPALERTLMLRAALTAENLLADRDRDRMRSLNKGLVYGVWEPEIDWVRDITKLP